MLRTPFRVATIALALSLAAGPLAHAQADEGLARREAIVGQILEAQGGIAAMRQVMQNAGEAAGAQMLSNLPADKADEAKAFLHQVMVDVANTMAPKLVQDAERVWAAEFTEQELRDILAFYQSPTGKSLAAKLPEISRQTGLIVGRHAPELQLMIVDRACAKFGCPANVLSQIEALKKQQARDAPL
jgi:hypothetical protein